jgi:hypothetical protein
MPPNSVYVGRQVRDRRQGAVRFGESKWHNPFKVPRGATREEVEKIVARVVSQFQCNSNSRPRYWRNRPTVGGGPGSLVESAAVIWFEVSLRLFDALPVTPSSQEAVKPSP